MIEFWITKSQTGSIDNSSSGVLNAKVDASFILTTHRSLELILMVNGDINASWQWLFPGVRGLAHNRGSLQQRQSR